MRVRSIRIECEMIWNPTLVTVDVTPVAVVTNLFINTTTILFIFIFRIMSQYITNCESSTTINIIVLSS